MSGRRHASPAGDSVAGECGPDTASGCLPWGRAENPNQGLSGCSRQPGCPYAPAQAMNHHPCRTAHELHEPQVVRHKRLQFDDVPPPRAAPRALRDPSGTERPRRLAAGTMQQSVSQCHRPATRALEGRSARRAATGRGHPSTWPPTEPPLRRASGGRRRRGRGGLRAARRAGGRRGALWRAGSGRS